MVARECADEALFCLYFDLLYFLEKCVIRRDVRPCRVLEGFGQVFLFVCSSSFLMESLDFLMLVSREAMSTYFRFLLGFWFSAEVLGRLFSWLFRW